MKKAFPNSNHHWWPKTLSAYWCDEAGEVTQYSPDDELRTERPEVFGVDKHTHNIRIGGPWNSSFESIFDNADAAIVPLINWLIPLEAKTINSNRLHERFQGQTLDPEKIEWLSSVLASLIVRSPALRDRIRRGVEWYRNEPSGLKADKTLIALNMRPLFEAFKNKIAVTGKFAVLFSPDREFIFGDGFFQSFPTVAPVHNNPKCIIPLTPAISVLYCSPSRYFSPPRLVTIRLTSSEVDHLNRLVQVYSNDRIFYRNEPPTLYPEFALNAHRELQYHSEPWTDAFIDALATFRE